jgi:teichuronic acid biosynthesis glycosyltransferase TuaC
MKIVLFVNSFLPNLGGKEIVVHYLAREMLRAGHRVRVVGPTGWVKSRHQKNEYPVHRWPTLRGLLAEKVSYAQLLLDTAIWGCDVVHAHTTYPNGHIVSLLKQTHRLPLVITPHGYDIHRIPELGFGHRMDPLKNRKIENALKCAEIVTAISDSVEASLRDAGCSAEKIRKIPNGIDIERFRAKNDHDIRQALGIAPDAKVILTVGNYHPRKGQDILIEAMPRILSQVPNAHLVVVGANQDALAQKVHALKLEQSVCLAGLLPFPASIKHGDRSKGPDDPLAALYCQSEVYVSASINKEAEGLSLAMLDAMAAGLPVVATRISGSSDIVIDSKTGFLVPPADHSELAESIITALVHRDRSITMGLQGQMVAQNYHWREIANRYLAVYREAIAKSEECTKR